MSTTLQYQRSNGTWTPAGDRADTELLAAVAQAQAVVARFADRALPASVAYAARVTDVASALAELEAGRILATGQDWYNRLRVKPAPRPLYNVDADAEAAKLAGENY